MRRLCDSSIQLICNLWQGVTILFGTQRPLSGYGMDAERLRPRRRRSGSVRTFARRHGCCWIGWGICSALGLKCVTYTVDLTFPSLDEEGDTALGPHIRGHSRPVVQQVGVRPSMAAHRLHFSALPLLHLSQLPVLECNQPAHAVRN